VDRMTWGVLLDATRHAVGRLPPPRRRPVYSDLLIVRMWLWAVMHDRPLSWACRRESYSSLFRPRRLPSVSRFSRRLRTRRFARLRVLLHEALTARGAGAALSFLDGKSLPIGDWATDRDARDGAVRTGRFRRGYKIHGRVNGAGFIEEYSVRSLNEGEAKVARTLLRRLPPGSAVVADANYDSRRLYSAIERRGAWLFTPIKGEAKAASTFRRMPASRREAIALWKDRPRLAQLAMTTRTTIERVFAHLCGFGGGLGPLPAWVRRLGRVRLWVEAKIAIYHARLIARCALQSTG